LAKRLSDEDRMVLSATARTIEEEVKWLYEEVKKRRGKVKDSLIKEVESKYVESTSSKKKKRTSLIGLKDICKLMDWEFPRDRDQRDRLQKLNNLMLITSGDYGSPLLFLVIKRGLVEDVDDPTDFFLSKKEQRKARKRRKIEEKHGVDNKVKMKMPKTEEEKKEARKERARIRREAAKLGITTEEYKKKMNAEEEPKEEKADALPEPETQKKTTVKRKSPGSSKKKTAKKKRSKKGNPTKRKAA
jgi:hypothetical protein